MNNELLMVIFRCILILIILFVLTKIMGKKQVSQMNIYDYLLGLTIGNIAAEVSLNIERDIILGLTALLIYSFSGIAVTYFSLKNLNFRKIFSGNPTVLIEKGKILTKNLKKEGIDINSLQEEARLNGYFDLSQIYYAIIETNGQISFMPYSKYNTITNENMNIKSKENNLCINLIQDGKVLEDNLKYINKDKKWLNKKLKEKGYSNYQKIFLCLYKNENNITIYNYEQN